MNAVKNSGTQNTLLSTLAGLVLVVGAGIATADTDPTNGQPRITVKYVATDLTSKAGAEALYKRIQDAAKKVCEDYKSDELVRQVVWQKCYSVVVENAVTAVHQPILTALHESRASTSRRG